MIKLQPLEQDLNFIESTCHDLNDYVLSDLLYWPVAVEPYSAGIAGSRATIGLLRFIIEHVRSKPLNQSQAESLEVSLGTIEKVRRKWAVAWENKAAAEFKARVRLWHAFISETQSNPSEFRSRYPAEVRNRAILQLILQDLSINDAALAIVLNQVDDYVRGAVESGVFIWDEDLKPSFPEDKFWFLYRDLK